MEYDPLFSPYFVQPMTYIYDKITVKLSQAEVQIWAQEECSGAGYGRRKVTPRMLCANALDRDACAGDSGGPLILSHPYNTIVGKCAKAMR